VYLLRRRFSTSKSAQVAHPPSLLDDDEPTVNSSRHFPYTSAVDSRKRPAAAAIATAASHPLVAARLPRGRLEQRASSARPDDAVTTWRESYDVIRR